MYYLKEKKISVDFIFSICPSYLVLKYSPPNKSNPKSNFTDSENVLQWKKFSGLLSNLYFIYYWINVIVSYDAVFENIK